MKAYLNILPITFCCLTLVACGGSGSGSNPQQPDPQNSNTFLGSWSSDCLVMENVSDSGETDNDFMTFGLVFTQDSFTHTFAAYVDESCTSQISSEEILVTATITTTGTYSDSGVVTTSSGLDANALSLAVTGITSQTENGPVQVIEQTEDALTAILPDLLVFVDSADVMFVSSPFLGGPETETIDLDVPFRRQ